MRVTALDGTEWQVTRRADGYSVPAAGAFVALTVIAWAAAFVFAVPGIVLVLELAVVPILVLLGPREYIVAALNTTTGEMRSERVRGRGDSQRAERTLARELSGRA